MGSEMHRGGDSHKDLMPLKGAHNFARDATFVSIKLKSPVKEGEEPQFTTQDEALFDQKPAQMGFSVPISQFITREEMHDKNMQNRVLEESTMEEGSPLKAGEELGKDNEHQAYRLNNYNRG